MDYEFEHDHDDDTDGLYAATSDSFEEYESEEYDGYWYFEGPLDSLYNSDEFFLDTESEEIKKVVRGGSEFEEWLANIIKNRPLSEFKYWEFLPSELKEMIADMLDFQAWINLMAAYGDDTGNTFCPWFQFRIKRFSFHSDVVQVGSKEMEHIRIRLFDNSDAHMTRIEECDGYCKLSWNSDNDMVGFVNLPNCNYLKVAEKFMETLTNFRCKSFKLVVQKNKTDPSAKSVSKWPYFHTFLKKCFGFRKENDVKKFVDDESIVDFVSVKTTSPVISIVNSMINATEHRRTRKKIVLTLPNLDAKKVVDTIDAQIPVMKANRKPGKSVENEKDVKFLYGCYAVSKISENTIEIDGPMSDYEYNKIFNIDEDYEGDVE